MVKKQKRFNQGSAQRASYNTNKILRRDAKAEKRNNAYQLRQQKGAQELLDMSPEQFAMYMTAEAMRAQAKEHYKGRVRTNNELQSLYRAQMRDLKKFERSLEKAKDMTGKERVSFLKPKLRDVAARFEDRKDRYNTLMGNEDAAMSLKSAGVLALGIGLVFGLGYGIGYFTGPEKTNEVTKTETEYKDAPVEKVYDVMKSGDILEDGVPLNDKDIVAKINATDIFTDKQIEEAQGLIEKAMNGDIIDLKVSQSGSLDVYLKSEESAGVSMEIENTISAEDVHKNIMPKLAGEDVPYVLQPVVEEGASEAVYPIDSSMAKTVKENAKITTSAGFNAVKISYNGDGNLQGHVGLLNEETGKFTVIDSLTHEQIDSALYTLADNNPDADKGVDDTKQLLKENAFAKNNDAFNAAKQARDAFLAKYNATSYDNVTDLIDDLESYKSEVEGFLANHSQTNTSGLGDMIADLEDIRDKRDDLLGKYNATNETALEEMIASLNTYIETLEQGWNAANGSHKAEIQGWMDDMNSTVANYTRYLDENKTKYELQIDGLEAELRQALAPLTAENITRDANSTGAWDLIKKQADRAGLDVYELDLTNETELNVLRQVFGDSLVDRWLSEDITRAEMINAVDTGEKKAVVALKDSKHLQYTETITGETWDAGEESLDPYKVDEY